MRAAILLCLAACGRIGFDGSADGAVGEDADVVSRDRCPPAPRPTGAPARIVGSGTAASCDVSALAAALASGGWIGFDCGPAMHTIDVTTELSITQATILDGGGRVTLDGGGVSRLLTISAGSQAVMLLDLVIANGASPDSGAGVRIQSGQVTIIGSTLNDNHGPLVGAIVGGGAIDVPPVMGTLAIYDSILRDNASANGGAINVWNDLTIVESELTGNSATGTGGSNGNGGLGGAIQNSGQGNLSLCGVTLANNKAGELGGALHRVCTSSTCADRITRTSIVDNTSFNAGGAYHQLGSLTMSQTTIANNTANNVVGGFWHVDTAATLVIEQVTIASNRAGEGIGAGLVAQASAGSISFSTIVDNSCTGMSCSSAAIDASSAMTLRATVIADNTITVPNVPVSCRTPMVDAKGNFQWPVMRPGGGTDNPTALCTSEVLVTDPMMAAPAVRAGPAGRFLVATPQPGSPSLALTSMCPAEDQLGRPRPIPCSAGAVEP